MVKIYILKNENGRVVDRFYLLEYLAEDFKVPQGFLLEQNDVAQIEEEIME